MALIALTETVVYSSGGPCVLCAVHNQPSPYHVHQRESESLSSRHCADLYCPVSCQHRRHSGQLQYSSHFCHKQVSSYTSSIVMQLIFVMLLENSESHINICGIGYIC